MKMTITMWPAVMLDDGHERHEGAGGAQSHTGDLVEQEAGKWQQPTVDEAQKLEYGHGVSERGTHEGVHVVQD